MFRNGQWGFAHDRLRKTWTLIRLVARRGILFTHITYGNPRTTSRLEGLNAQIRDLLRPRRGMSEEHRRRAVEWFLVTRELDLTDAIKSADPIPKNTATPQPDDQISRIVYDTAPTAEEGLWARSGHVH